MAGQGSDPAQSLDPVEKDASESKAPKKAVLFDPSTMNWGPNCKFVRLPIGPNGADCFLALNTTPRPDGGE
jgi:hypothetical protein